MRSRVRIFVAAFACALLMAGCFEVDSAREQEICFRAGSPLLNDDNTKSETLKDAFGNGDCFYVFGAKTVNSSHVIVFGEENNPLQVSYNGSAWSYSPTQSWDESASGYDFLAISRPSTAVGTISCNPASFPFVASLIYDVEAQYDLMVACEGREKVADPGHFTDPVHLNFYHTLSAVSVTVYNDSPSLDITLNSYGFKNLYRTATLTVEYFDDDPQSSWMVSRFETNTVLGDDSGSLLYGMNKEGSHSYPAALQFDLMIPQDLDPVSAYIPKLVLNYSYQEDPEDPVEEVETHINLKDIKIKGSDQAITSWEKGTKYNYEIHIRYGGGIRVHVITTPWEVVNAQTPGLQI